MRRFLCLALSLALTLSLAVSVSAQEYDQLRQDMKESFHTGQMLDISSYKLTFEEVQQIYDSLYHSGQLPWYAEENCSYVFSSDQTVSKFRPTQMNPKSYDRELYERKLAELIAQTCLPGMTDWQMALSVHDHIVLHTLYDEDMKKNTGYHALVEGTTVCYGYSMLYMDVLNRLGIPCQIVICNDTGDGFGHAWNLVQLEGGWYHADLTWADPMPDMEGFVSHDHFLKTDREFRENREPHDFPWEALEETAAQPFTQDDFLEGIYSPLCFVDADTVVYRRETGDTNRILSRDLTTGEETTLYQFERSPQDLGYGTYLYPTFGLCLWNGRIYFNREDRVISILPNGEDARREYTYEVDERYVMGCSVREGVLRLSLGDHDMQPQLLEVPLEDTDYHTHSYHRVTVKASCTQPGYYEQACDCGITYNRVEIPMIDHLLQSQVVKAPTQQQPGERVHTCVHCGYTQTEEIPSLPAPEPGPAPQPELRTLLTWLAGIGGGVAAVLTLALCLVTAKQRKKRSRT